MALAEEKLELRSADKVGRLTLIGEKWKFQGYIIGWALLGRMNSGWGREAGPIAYYGGGGGSYNLCGTCDER